MQNKCQKHLFLPMKTSPPPVCPLNTRPHTYVENVPVCTGTTRTCFNTCARCAGIHGDVFNVHMGTCLSGHTGFFQRFTPHHNTAHTTQTTHHTMTQDTTPHGDRQRQTETETEGEEGTKEKTTRQEQREERRVKREKIHFQCGGAWPFFIGVVIFRLIPFAHVT